MTQIIWLCHGATTAMRTGAFPTPDDAIDEGGLQKIATLPPGDLRHDRAVTSPSRGAIETASALGMIASQETAIRDVDFGQWAGKSFEDIASCESEAMAAWHSDPTITVPQGEPLADAAARVSAWIEAQREVNACILAIAQPMIIRIAIAHALNCPLLSACNIDIVPLSRTSLSFNRKWRLQELARAKS